MNSRMKKSAFVSSIIAVCFLWLALFAAPAAFAQGGGRGGGGMGGGGAGRGGGAAIGGGGRGGTIGGAHRPSFGHHHVPHKGFHHGSRHHFRHRNFFSFGVSAFYPGWWYSPYYYYPPPAYYYPYYYPAYSGYPAYDYYGYPYYDYYGSPYWSDPCLSPDPAYAEYCPPPPSPSQGEYGTAPVTGTTPDASVQPFGQDQLRPTYPGVGQ